MKREIKFRAWDKRFKKMEYAAPMAILNMDDSDHEIMQFTGLKDRNGKEIWEGDIVSIPTNPRPFIVQWNKYFWEIDVPNTVYHSGLGAHDSSCEVIGNIYEHPDLLARLPKSPSL